MNTNSPRLNAFSWGLLVVFLLASFPADAATPTLTVSFVAIPQGTNVDLTVAGPIDWVHWGLYTETSLDRKAGVTPLISDFTILYATNAYAYAYQFADNYNDYSWSDGTPTASVTNTPTGVWAYGVPTRNSGFQFTVPADTTLRTLKVYVGAFSAKGNFEASLSDNSASAYSDTTLVNMGNGPSGVYSISYAAQSAGQTLTVKWTLTMPTRPDANVTLQAAALSVPGANNPQSSTSRARPTTPHFPPARTLRSVRTLPTPMGRLPRWNSFKTTPSWTNQPAILTA